MTFRKICYHCLKSKVFDVYTNKVVCRRCKNEVKLTSKAKNEINLVMELRSLFKPKLKDIHETTEWLGYIAPNTLSWYNTKDGHKNKNINIGRMVFYSNFIAVRLESSNILQKEKVY